MIEPYHANPRIYENPKYRNHKREHQKSWHPAANSRHQGAQFRKIHAMSRWKHQVEGATASYTKKPMNHVSRPAYCEFREWQGEANLMVGHVVENELRGNLNWARTIEDGIDFARDARRGDGKGNY